MRPSPKTSILASSDMASTKEFNLGGRYHELAPFSVRQTVSEFPPIKGAWGGHFFLDVFQTRTDSLVDIVITSCTAHGKFEGHGFEAIDGKFTVYGSIQHGEGSTFKVEFTREYPSIVGRASIICVGEVPEVDPMANSFRGEWRFTTGHSGEPVLLTRTSAPIYRFRYTKAAFESNRARARWSFACTAVRHQVSEIFPGISFRRPSLCDGDSYIFIYGEI
jgi:hypothetical protein